MSKVFSIAGRRALWLSDSSLQQLLAALSYGGNEARIVGGAIRNTLLGRQVHDLDIATTTLPQETIQCAKKCGFKVVPIGIKHGTVRVIAKHKSFEVTTLRADIDADGRHATVAFGNDWKIDAERRDFTMNALYAKADGMIVDYVGGLKDIETRTLRFIGNPEIRIREDYLRIVRFFRFFAWYAEGRPEVEGMKACTRLKDGLARLSAERIWEELKKLLSAPDPSRALLWMRLSGVLTAILPESEKWGIDAIHGLVRAERDLNWQIDPILRLESLVPSDVVCMKGLGQRLKMSKIESARLEAWARTDAPKPTLSDLELAQQLYHGMQQAFVDRLRLALAAARSKTNICHTSSLHIEHYAHLLQQAEIYEIPQFPVTGGDLIAVGLEKGPKIGHVQRALEKIWVESGFALDRAELLSKVSDISGKI